MTNRPSSFADFHGQASVVNQLKIAVRSAKARSVPLGHVLITGPAGLGKSTLAGHVVPYELGVGCQTLNCAGIEKPQQILPVICTARAGSVLFLDEVHMLPTAIREHLLTVLEDSQVTIDLSEGMGKPKMQTLTLPKFTIVAATTRLGLLPETLRDRFKLQLQLEQYDDESMRNVILWIASNRGLTIEPDAATAFVPYCRGTARWAVRIIDAVVDTLYGSEQGATNVVTLSALNTTLSRLGFVKTLLPAELKLLQALASAPNHRLGLTTLAAVLDDDVTTVEQTIEPWLLQQRLIVKDSNGRRLTELAHNVLKDLHV